jgi:pantothenate synthetase
MKDIAQLAVFIRGVQDFQIIVELAELTTMKGKTCTTNFYFILVTL